MGVKNFNKWIYTNFPKCYTTNVYKKRIYDNIYVDINHILHVAIHESINHVEFKKNITKRLNYIFCNYVPLKNVFLVVDGPPPFAKLILQRMRRSETDSNNIDNDLNPILLTPGTELMDFVSNILESYKKYLRNLYKITKPKIHVSCHDENGEGEIKILRNLIKYGNKSLPDSHLIISKDADAIIMSMNVRPIYNIYVLTTFSKNNVIVSIKKLILLLTKKILNNKSHIYFSNNFIRNDFVLIMILMGNDYIPKIYGINIDSIWKTYIEFVKNNKNFKGFIINDKETNLDLFLEYLKLLENNTRKYSKKYNKKLCESYIEMMMWSYCQYSVSIPINNTIYKYSDSDPPSLSNLVKFLSQSKTVYSIDDFTKNIIDIPYKLCPVITFPIKYKSKVDPKYKEIMETYLFKTYEKELCVKCKEYNKNLILLNSRIKYFNTMRKHTIKKSDCEENIMDEKEIRNNKKKLIAEQKLHSKSHNTIITTKDILKVIELGNKLN